MPSSLSLEDAAVRLRVARRVLVIGCSGSGKSTLARALCARLDLRHISMDKEIFWMSGWQERPHEEAMQRLQDRLGEDRWVIDGTSPGSLHLRLPRTDLLIWLRPSRRTSLGGALSRWWQYRGRTRPEMADGCPEKIDLEFLTYIWTFEQRQAPRIEEGLARFGMGVPVLILRSRSDMNRLLTMLA